jgi:hypothetical protein
MLQLGKESKFNLTYYIQLNLHFGHFSLKLCPKA